MCKIVTTRVRHPYPGFQQILYRRDVLYDGEVLLDPLECGFYFSLIPEETRYFLLLFLAAPHWSIACDILAAYPALMEPWAANLLHAIVREGILSAEDSDCFREHMVVLDMASSQGIEQTRRFLNQRI